MDNLKDLLVAANKALFDKEDYLDKEERAAWERLRGNMEIRESNREIFIANRMRRIERKLGQSLERADRGDFDSFLEQLTL